MKPNLAELIVHISAHMVGLLAVYFVISTGRCNHFSTMVRQVIGDSAFTGFVFRLKGYLEYCVRWSQTQLRPDSGGWEDVALSSVNRHTYTRFQYRMSSPIHKDHAISVASELLMLSVSHISLLNDS
jgi:hypothetical protein